LVNTSEAYGIVHGARTRIIYWQRFACSVSPRLVSMSASPARATRAAARKLFTIPRLRSHIKTPPIIQMEAVECGAASLAIVLAYYGRIVPLEQLRVDCGVSRDGSKASNIVKAARTYGLQARGYKAETAELQRFALPLIVFWNFNHFLVVEGFGKEKVYLNDPARGRLTVDQQEFDECFTGVALVFEKEAGFRKAGSKPSVFRALASRLRGSGLELTYLALATLGLALPNLITPFFLKIYVDSFLRGGLASWVKPLLLAMVVAAVLKAILTFLQQNSLLHLGTKLALSSSAKFFWHILRLPNEFLAQRYAGEIGSRVQLNERIANLLSGDVATNLVNALLIGFYVALLFQCDRLLTFVGVLMAIANLVALRLFSSRRTHENNRLLQERGSLTGISVSGLQSIETLKASAAESDFFSHWAGLHAKAINAEQSFAVSTLYQSAIPILLSGFNTALILGLGGLRIIHGSLTMGMLVAFQALMISFMEPLNKLVALGSKTQEISSDLARLDDTLKYPTDPEVDRSGALKVGQSAFDRLAGYIELRDVTFGYSRLEPPLIVNFSLSVKPGQRIAVVGASGSGKSTVAKIVAGLYWPWSGAVWFDGRPREEFPRSVLNNSVSLVDQEVFLFDGSIRDNIRMWDATIEESRLVQAAADAAIHDEIAALPGGYDFRLEEGGRNLSGGQRQRIEIARALVSNPRVLLLDEATSALDAATEKHVGDCVRRRGCTCVIAAHRLSTIRDADEIIVLDRGKVVQRGSHEAMMLYDGPYRRLIEAI
jgi:NHLM bacteriocin system ABC transporter peptidase/ATP-binding protein